MHIKYSIFIDASGNVFALYEGKQHSFKRTLNQANKVKSQVKMGKNLVTNEPVVVKIEVLNSDKFLQERKRQFIDNEVSCGIKAKLVQSSGYIEQGDTLKHYQFIYMVQGKPMPEPLSAMQIERLNPSILTEEQKIDIVVSIISELKIMHFTHNILHRDLYGDNILIHQTSDGTFTATFIDYGISAHLTSSEDGKLSYFGPRGDDVWCSINALTNDRMPIGTPSSVRQTVKEDISRVMETIAGLEIKNDKAKDQLYEFRRQKQYNRDDYDALIEYLNALKNQSSLVI